jgi:short-subunit dehydrogenase
LSRTKTELEETAAECEKFGVKTVVLPADMTDEEQVNAAVAKVKPKAFQFGAKIIRLKRLWVQ